jgi:hypothetical protein
MVPHPEPPFEAGEFFADVTFTDLASEALAVAHKDFQRCTFRR